MLAKSSFFEREAGKLGILFSLYIACILYIILCTCIIYVCAVYSSYNILYSVACRIKLVNDFNFR